MLADNDTRIHNDAAVGIAAIAKAMRVKGFKYKTNKSQGAFMMYFSRWDSSFHFILGGLYTDEGKTVTRFWERKVTIANTYNRILDNANHKLSASVYKAGLHKKGIEKVLAYINAMEEPK